MLETILADVAQELLQLGNLDHSDPTEGIERVAGELPFANIPANGSAGVVGGESGEAHSAWLHAPDHSAVGVLFADGARDDLLEVHADLLEEVLGQVAAMKADGLIGIVPVVVVPVEQSARCFRGERESVHTQRSADIDFAGGRE